jgi:hypothetical protein
MEGRRVEGVLLDSSVLRSRAQEAYRVSRAMEIRILSSVPEALLSSLGGPGSRFTALVREVTPQRVVLLLENGYEIYAENRLSQPVREGERLSLLLESRNPFVLRVEASTFSVGTRDLWRSVLKEGVAFIRLVPERLKESLENSGLLYERKVWTFLKGETPRSYLERDTKYKLLRRLNSFSTSSLEEILRKAPLTGEMKRRAEDLLRVARSGDRLKFFTDLKRFSSEIAQTISLLERDIEGFTAATAHRVGSLIRKLEEILRDLGLKVTVNKRSAEAFLRSPKALDILRSTVESLKLNRWGEAVDRLRIVGLQIKNPESLPAVGGSLLRQMEPLIRGAVQGLLEDTGFGDIRELIETYRRKQEDLNNLRSFRDTLENSVPRGVKENLQRIDLIGFLQSYMVAREGRKLVLPFRTEDGKGVLVLSLSDTYRVLIRLEYGEGFVGVLLEAPRRKNPGHLNLSFLTNVPRLKEEIERRSTDLREALKEIGLELRRFEVKDIGREEFEERILEDLGDESSFAMRV